MVLIQVPSAVAQGFDFGPTRLVIIQPTTFCNLDCDYCYLPNRQLKSKFSIDLLEPIFRNLFSSEFVDKQFTVVWHAGEPLSVPVDFYRTVFDKIEKLNQSLTNSEYTIRHSIQTNATLINQAWCDLINEYRVQLGVSLDGPAFLHDAHRKTRKGTGTHASVMRGVSFLQRNQIDFKVIAVVTRQSLDYADEVFDFFVEHQIRYVGFNIDEMEGIHDSSSFDYGDLEEKVRKFMKQLYKRSKESNSSLIIREFEGAKSFILGKSDTSKGQFTPFNMINIDHAGNFTTYSPELLAQTSSIYGDFILGNVLNTSFDAACETEKFQQMHRDVQSGVERCRKTCQYFSVCGGGAPSNKYFENGSFDSSETVYCRYTKQIISEIVLEDLETYLGLR
ncbi:MAG: cyclophane-forming radical SAM/SPASM peptide maturase GrrM/OscB [Elainellaceae cyanobacterium]